MQTKKSHLSGIIITLFPYLCSVARAAGLFAFGWVMNIF